ncbi:MAG: FAD binding domain-containing protein [Candidatus Eiseniibacteriota bacterium]
MRSHLPDFEVFSPRSLEDALTRLAGSPGKIRPLAGATDLYVLLNAGQLPPGPVMSLHRVPELRSGFTWDGDRVTFGALTTYSDARRDPIVSRRLPLLGLAARELGALQIQNRGTWAGNIANASPAADGVPVLMAYDGEVELASVHGRRRVALDQYFHGYKKTERSPDELIVSLTVKAPAPGAFERFRKVGTRRLQAISKTVLASVVERSADGRRVTRARLALGSVAPVTLRARHAEDALLDGDLGETHAERVATAVAQDVSPIDDVRSTREYRMRVTQNLLRELVLELGARP